MPKNDGSEERELLELALSARQREGKRRKEMDATFQSLIQQALGIIEMQNKLLNLISEARQKEARLKIEWERKQEELARLYRDKVILISALPEVSQAVDPKTGKPNKDWSQMLMMQLLEQDSEYMEANTAFQELQEEYYMAKVELADLAEKLGVYKNQAILIAALLQMMSEIGGAIDVYLSG